MKHAFQTLIAATAVAAIVGAAAPASAAITKADAACHAAIAKNITKLQATLLKNQAGCHKSRSGLKLPFSTDCNSFAVADSKGKGAAAATKARDAILKSCDTTAAPELTADVLSLYPRCPSPVADVDNTGTPGIDNFGELADCLIALSKAYVDRAGVQFMGAPVGSCYDPVAKAYTATTCTSASDCTGDPTPGETCSVPKPIQSCQGAIGKAVGKAFGTVAKSRSKCQATADKALPASIDYSGCATGDPDGKIGPALAAVTAAVDACVDTNGLNQAAFHQMDLCGQNKKALETCVGTRVVTPLANGLVAATQELPGTCAARADVVINAGFGQKLSNSRLDSGWTGLAQDVDVVDQSLGGVKLQSCDADCENCQVRIDSTNGYCRCENDPTVKCGTVEGADAACGASAKCVGGTDEGEVCVTGATCNSGVCGAATCHCMFGPPLALSSGGTPVCVVNRFASDFSGTTGKVGEYNVLTRTRALVHTSSSGVVPCPVCTGDPTLNDGVKAGHCSSGPRVGKTCDANANHPDFGLSSFDCPPDPATNISGAGLNLALSFSSGSVSLTAGITGTSCNAGTCHCSECTDTRGGAFDADAKLIGCSNNTDCTSVGVVGTCGVNLGSDNPKQNGCTGGVANCDTDGLCTAGPYDQFCDGYTKKNGDGYLPCLSDADCTVGSLGFDAGHCNSVVQRRCFGTTISAQGTPGIFNSEGVSAFCSAATGSAPVNKAGGLPGPGRVKLDFDFNVYCGAGNTLFQEPGGSNCP